MEKWRADAAKHFDSSTKRAKYNQKFGIKGGEFRNEIDHLVDIEFRKQIKEFRIIYIRNMTFSSIAIFVIRVALPNSF